jgi:hypothetical protein
MEADIIDVLARKDISAVTDATPIERSGSFLLDHMDGHLDIPVELVTLKVCRNMRHKLT